MAAGPDVAEEGHAGMLRFIRTCRNTEMTVARGAEQTGGSSAESEEWDAPRAYGLQKGNGGAVIN